MTEAVSGSSIQKPRIGFSEPIQQSCNFRKAICFHKFLKEQTSEQFFKIIPFSSSTYWTSNCNNVKVQCEAQLIYHLPIGH